MCLCHHDTTNKPNGDNSAHSLLQDTVAPPIWYFYTQRDTKSRVKGTHHVSSVLDSSSRGKYFITAHQEALVLITTLFINLGFDLLRWVNENIWLMPPMESLPDYREDVKHLIGSDLMFSKANIKKLDVLVIDQ